MIGTRQDPVRQHRETLGRLECPRLLDHLAGLECEETLADDRVAGPPHRLARVRPRGSMAARSVRSRSGIGSGQFPLSTTLRTCDEV